MSRAERIAELLDRRRLWRDVAVGAEDLADGAADAGDRAAARRLRAAARLAWRFNETAGAELLILTR